MRTVKKKCRTALYQSAKKEGAEFYSDLSNFSYTRFWFLNNVQIRHTIILHKYDSL